MALGKLASQNVYWLTISCRGETGGERSHKLTIIHLTKVSTYGILLYMEANGHPFLGLAAEREACITFRKSFLMLASNFLVGTLFNSSRFCFASIGGSL